MPAVLIFDSTQFNLVQTPHINLLKAIAEDSEMIKRVLWAFSMEFCMSSNKTIGSLKGLHLSPWLAICYLCGVLKSTCGGLMVTQKILVHGNANAFASWKAIDFSLPVFSLTASVIKCSSAFLTVYLCVCSSDPPLNLLQHLTDALISY